MLFLGGRSNYEYFDILSNNCVEISLVKLVNNQTMSTSMFFLLFNVYSKLFSKLCSFGESFQIKIELVFIF